jgi:hypothetical protein
MYILKQIQLHTSARARSLFFSHLLNKSSAHGQNIQKH